MKAVGATNRDVLSVFLGEAAGIGFLGGLGGLILGWSAAQILNVLAMSYLAGQAASQGGLPPTVAVYTPIWLPIFALIFAMLHEVPDQARLLGEMPLERHRLIDVERLEVAELLDDRLDLGAEAADVDDPAAVDEAERDARHVEQLHGGPLHVRRRRLQMNW